MRLRIGVLSFQGDFEAHARALQQTGAEAVQVRNREQLFSCEGLIIPGGESTTLLKFLEYENFAQPLLDFGREHPIFGTCAGAILLARDVENPSQISLGLMDIGVRRNAYGRQLESHVQICHSCVLNPSAFEAIFIRAPMITRAGPSVEVLARSGPDPIWVRDEIHWASTFHPELSSDRRIHQMFLEAVRQTRSTGSLK
ncbi:MAG: pyridoxal 5'-phosphate synthase glutaminase subunit PdxT [Acidobacteria bacterium]|nr:pyridoxal 5'-phosphate synthase glutaminase subunit PdxT [Acidobacteriota bacterium]